MGIPALAALAAPRVPVAWEEGLGRSAMGYLAPQELVCGDPRLRQALDPIVTRLAAAAPASPYTFRLVVVNQPQVNALAAPGGYIVVYRGLLERTRSPEELAGVLAHEMQHVIQRHATQALIQHTSTGLLLAALTGDMTGPLVYGLQSARVLGQLQYSRRAESQADVEGLKMLQAARIDPGGMVRFFEALAKADRQPAMLLKYLSTDPSPIDRIERLKALAAATPGQPVPLLPVTDWNNVKRLCEAPGPPRLKSSEEGFAPLPNLPPGQDCAGEAGARTTSAAEGSCYRLLLRIESVVDLLLPLYEAEMVADVLEDAVFVATVKVADDVPAATVTLGGTVAADVLELVSAITAPPGGAGPDRVTVPVELEPPVTVDGFRVSDEGLGRDGGVTVSVAVRVTPEDEAVIATDVDVVTAAVAMENDADVALAPIVTLAGTLATPVFALERVTTTPLLGAGPLRVTVPAEA